MLVLNNELKCNQIYVIHKGISSSQRYNTSYICPQNILNVIKVSSNDTEWTHCKVAHGHTQITPKGIAGK